MFVVHSTTGFYFECCELGDAVSLADSVAADLQVDVSVIDEDTHEVVYLASG